MPTTPYHSQEDTRTPQQRLIDQRKRAVVSALDDARDGVEGAARIASLFAAESLAVRLREIEAEIENASKAFYRIQVKDRNDGEPFEACIDEGSGDTWFIGGLYLEWGTVVDLKLQDGSYIRTTSDTETYAGSVTKSGLHLNFPVLAQPSKPRHGWTKDWQPEPTVEVQLPLRYGIIVRWVRELTRTERAAGTRPLCGVVAASPHDAYPLKLQGNRRTYDEKDFVGDTELVEGEAIEVFLADGRPLAGVWGTERSSYGRRIRVGFLKFKVSVKEDWKEDDVYLPLMENGILIRRRSPP